MELVRGAILQSKTREKVLMYVFTNTDQLHVMYICLTSILQIFIYASTESNWFVLQIYIYFFSEDLVSKVCKSNHKIHIIIIILTVQAHFSCLVLNRKGQICIVLHQTQKLIIGCSDNICHNLTQNKGKESENLTRKLKSSWWTGTRTHTQKQNRKIFQRTRPSFSIRRELMYVSTRKGWHH